MEPRRLRVIDPTSPDSTRAPLQGKLKPPKPRSMREMNAILDRLIAENNAASRVYTMMNHMILVLKDEVKALKEQGNKNEESVVSGTGLALREELSQHTYGSDLESAP